MHFQVRDSGQVVALQGVISEESDFSAVLSTLRGQVALDLGAVTHINSCGVREWVNFIRAMPGDTQLTLERCPIIFVNQMNLIANFIGRAHVKSIFVPYACTSCSSVQDELMETAALKEHRGEVPLKCKECGAPLELDAMPDLYFEFLAR